LVSVVLPELGVVDGVLSATGVYDTIGKYNEDLVGREIINSFKLNRVSNEH
jgi:hypothetical protein